ncbi:hypothetical protein [Bacillus sp. SH8-8]|uniref:hypothetical protein n=1 Tax=Bacillus sp. SH8-8 TaxID=2217830 RepID=UPI0034D57289
MGMSTILVLGGSNGRTLEKLAKKRDCQVIFHDGKNHGGAKKYDVPLLFNPGFGGTDALEMGLKLLNVA